MYTKNSYICPVFTFKATIPTTIKSQNYQLTLVLVFLAELWLWEQQLRQSAVQTFWLQGAANQRGSWLIARVAKLKKKICMNEKWNKIFKLWVMQSHLVETKNKKKF